MTNNSRNIYRNIDWVLIICYLLLVFFGWINIYASVYNQETSSIFSLSQRSGMQFLWICISISVAILLIFVINPKLYMGMVWWLYLFTLLLLVAVLIFGREVNGSKSWLILGPVALQPSELSKITTSLALATFMSKYNYKITITSNLIKTILILAVPAFLIILEPDAGTVLVYCGFVFMLYREGLTGWVISIAMVAVLLFVLTLKFSPFVSILVLLALYGILKGVFQRRVLSGILIYTAIIGLFAFIPKLLQWNVLQPLSKIDASYYLLILILPVLIISVLRDKKIKLRRTGYMKYLIITFVCATAFIFSVEFIFDKVLKEHHRDRIENLLGITQDLQGAGYNVNQSKIAIGSGGLTGKGFLEGTQTKFRFVPEQSTDFIFCTIGEEWGFIGTFGVLMVFMVLILRIISNAEKQKDSSIRIYGYCVACCLFMHVFINISMTIGLFPVVGIPLPFISYGGTSFLSFTILLFIFIRLDLERWK